MAPTDRSGADRQGHARRLGSARDAMLAVTRLLSPDGDLQAPDAVRERLVNEAREFFGVRRVVLLRAEGTRPPADPGLQPRRADPARARSASTSSRCCATRPRTTPSRSPPATPRWRWTRRWARWTRRAALLALPMQIQARRGARAGAGRRRGTHVRRGGGAGGAGVRRRHLGHAGAASDGGRARRADRPAGGAGPRRQDPEREPGPEPRAGADQPRGGQHPGRRQRHRLPRRRRGRHGGGGHASACRRR